MRPSYSILTTKHASSDGHSQRSRLQSCASPFKGVSRLSCSFLFYERFPIPGMFLFFFELGGEADFQWCTR